MQQSRTSSSLNEIISNKFRYRKNKYEGRTNSKRKTLRTHRRGR